MCPRHADSSFFWKTVAYEQYTQFSLTNIFSWRYDFNILIQNYISGEWEQIQKIRIKNICLDLCNLVNKVESMIPCHSLLKMKVIWN